MGEGEREQKEKENAPRKKEEKRNGLVRTVRCCEPSYLTVENPNFPFRLHQQVVPRHRLLTRRLMGVQVLCSEFRDVVVVDVHSPRRFSLVLAGTVVISLVVVELVGL
jgi:hypothetical protein